MPLTNKQEKFARLIALEGLNQSDAYRQAYDVGPDTLPQTASSNGYELANNTHIALRITELKASLEAAAVTDAAAVLTELKTVGMAAISGHDVRPSDKVAALDKMAKILGLYKDQDDRDSRPAAITQVTIVLSQGGKVVEEELRVVEQAPVDEVKELEAND